MVLKFSFASALAALAVAGSARAAVLNVVGGELLGASGVDVNGTLYDVLFDGGSCASMFDGCDETADFGPFAGDEVAALAAAQALLDQVLIDGPEGMFDSQPNLVAGCGLPQSCAVRIPYQMDGPSWEGALANNVWSGSMTSDIVVTSTSGPGSINSPGSTLAVFTPVAAVPLPASGVLGLAGLAALGMATRRRS
ncbi:MAG: hypothetical protein AAGA87_10765 [Pseudomonadota bacterium]